MNRKTKASLFLMIICVQYLFMGFNVVNVNSSSGNELEHLETDLSTKRSTSHSSPYYFPTNLSTPLMTEEASDISEEDSPKQSSYYYYDSGYVLTLNLDRYVLTPGETVTINLVVTLNLTASVGEYVSVEIYDEFYRDFRWYDPDYDDGLAPIYTTDVITNIDGEASFSFSSTSETGIYTVYAFIEENRAYKEFSVGNTGIFCKGPIYYKPDHTYTAAVHVANISDFTGIPLSTFNYSISYYERSFSEWFVLTMEEIQTDAMGYAIINVDIPIEMNDYYTLKLTLRTSDGEAEYETYLYKSWDYYYYSLWGGQAPTNQEKVQYVVTTDKTIYSPGEFIHLRALVLEYSFMNESKRALKNTPISLTIYNPDGLAIFWSSLTTDEHGIITYTLPLDEDCELGLYGFEFSTPSSNYRYEVRVDFYTKPVFRVEIDTNGKDFYSMTDSYFKGFVYVSYYFGQPVVGASVELTLFDYMGEVKKTIEGFTNGEGRFYFAINLQFIINLQYTFKAEVNVVDSYGRSASTAKMYTRMKDIFAYGYLSNWAPRPDEYSEYYFYVYQYIMSDTGWGYWNWNYNPLANVSVKIEIFGVEGYPFYRSSIANGILLQTHFAKTNNFGSGKLEFKLPLLQILPFDLFEVRLTVKLEDNRATTSSYYYRYKKYSLDISIVDSTLDPGQDLEFDVTFKNILSGLPTEGEGRIYIYDSKHQQIGRANEIISGTKRYTLNIPNFYPEGVYYIYTSVFSKANEYYGGFSYHSAHESFKVGNIQAISFKTNFTNTGTYYDQITVQQDDIISITGTSNVSTNLSHFIEIYKRGLLYSTPLTLIGNNFSYVLPIIEDFVPDFTIIVYTISDSGELFESVLAVHVEYSYSFELSTDKEIYEPGDTITLTITPSENQTSMYAISFIDSAVLDVEPEDDSELAFFTENSYYTYISSGSSWGSGFDYRSYWWYWCGTPSGGIYMLYDSFLFYDREFYAFADTPGGLKAMPSFDDLLFEFGTEIRKNISESANWIPKLIISEPTELKFKLPDNIGEWTIRVVGNALSESSNSVVLAGAVETIKIKTFLPFFIEFEIPQTIAQDDILSIKGYIYNYIGTDVEAYVAIDAPNLVVLNKEIQ
ncbi:MAG: MG2 domain-containing protein, partial [Promethearchaeota archaeon]